MRGIMSCHWDFIEWNASLSHFQHFHFHRESCSLSWDCVSKEGKLKHSPDVTEIRRFIWTELIKEQPKRVSCCWANKVNREQTRTSQFNRRLSAAHSQRRVFLDVKLSWCHIMGAVFQTAHSSSMSTWRLSCGGLFIVALKQLCLSVSHAPAGKWNMFEWGDIFIDQERCFTFPLYHLSSSSSSSVRKDGYTRSFKGSFGSFRALWVCGCVSDPVQGGLLLWKLN